MLPLWWNTIKEKVSCSFVPLLDPGDATGSVRLTTRLWKAYCSYSFNTLTALNATHWKSEVYWRQLFICCCCCSAAAEDNQLLCAMRSQCLSLLSASQYCVHMLHLAGYLEACVDQRDRTSSYHGQRRSKGGAGRTRPHLLGGSKLAKIVIW